MLKKTTLLLFTIFLSVALHSQVGIGTLTPETDLHIAGDLLVQEDFNIKPLPSVTQPDEDFKLVTRLTNSTPLGEIAILNVDSLTVAPINVINYEFTNIFRDNLSDVNLQYSAEKYVVGVANFRYVGDAIQKQDGTGGKTIGTFVLRTFVSNNQWHLEIKNRDLDLEDGKSVRYYVTLIVYDKSYYRNLPPIVTDLGGSNTGTASSIPDLY
tara:strand:+ start:19400 stop:20032 length:633 start_codon:yes stop_codon:yes gene_type:complete